MVQGFLPMLLTCAYWSPQEEKKVPSSELGNGMVLWGVLRMLRVPWEVNEKNHYVRQSPSECLVMSSGRFGEKEHSINRHERLVLGCDEQR